MRTLSPYLTAAAQTFGSPPDVRLELADAAPHFAVVRALGETASRTSACIAPDGALVAACVLSSGLYIIRVTDPSDVVLWNAWTFLTSDARLQAGCCCIVAGATVRVLWQKTSTTQVCATDSTDSGVSWGATAVLFDPAHACWGLAGDGDLGTVLLAYNPGTGVARPAAWHLAGTWSGLDWTNGDWGQVVGIDAVRNVDGSYSVVLAGWQAAGSPSRLVSCTYVYGGAPAWSVLTPLQTLLLATGIYAAYPHLTHWGGLYRLTWVEQDSGAVDGVPYARLVRASSADFVHWTAGTASPGTAVTCGAVWLQHALGQVLAGLEAVLFAPSYDPATDYRDLTADLLRLEVVEAEGKPATLTATLDNSAGQYSGLAALKVRAQILLSQGFVGAGLIPTHLFYVESWTFARAVDVSEIAIVALDASWCLEYETCVPLSYASRQIIDIVFDLAAQAGFERASTIDGSQQFNQIVTTYQLVAGETYTLAMQRMLRAWAGAWRVRVVPAPGVAFAAVDWLDVIGKSASQATVWSYGVEAEALQVGVDGDRANRVAVRGPTKIAAAVAEVWDSADLAATGRERYALVVEQLATTAGGAVYAAQFALAREQRLATQVQLTVGPNPALELYDAVALTDSILPGLSCRIVGLRLTVDARSSQYELQLSCEGM